MVQDINLNADCYSVPQEIARLLTEPEDSSTCSQKPATGPILTLNCITHKWITK